MIESTTQSRKRIGEIFKSKREEMHLSIKEVENATSIRMAYLQAIEEGQIDRFLSATYALGFIKQYASFLGFDGQKILDENREAFLLPKQKLEVPYGLGSLDGRSSRHTSRSSSNVIWISVGIFILILAYVFARWSKLF